MGERNFANPFPNFKGETLLKDNGEINDAWNQTVRASIDRLLHYLYRGLEEEDDSDYSIYTGVGGIALLHFHMFNKLGNDPRHLETSLSYIKRPLRHLKRKRWTFICGDAGPLALGAVLYTKLNKEDKATDCIHRLVALHETVCSDKYLPDEFLFGRVGYLFSLLFVQHHLGTTKIDNSVIHKVFKCVIESGQMLARQTSTTHPLMYMWHEKYYLGAAHGLAGIFYTLMQVPDPTGVLKPYLTDLVKPSIDYMLTLRFPSGNCPSSLGSQTGDKLVHWCHGAPGWIHMFALAYKKFSDDKYLEAAKKCAEVIWERGLLKKGYGVCHGTAGNAYGFLTMYNLTNDLQYLYKANKFAEWCIDYGKHGCRTPDAPYSLFEGMAGTIYFLIDLLKPSEAKFPAFEL